MRSSQYGFVKGHSRLILFASGSWSEYAECAENSVALKPSSLSFADAAAVPLAGVTALQALRRYRGSLSGKTVFVPAGCKLCYVLQRGWYPTNRFAYKVGGAGSFACQLAKNVFGASKVITTVSTSKVDKVPELLGEGIVDRSS